MSKRLPTPGQCLCSSARAAFAAADLALAASGTVSLDLAANNVPMVIGYDVAPLSRLIIRMLLKTDTVTLVNLVSETRAAKQPTLADLHDELASEIQQKAVEAKVDELTKAAKIEKPGEALDPALLTKTELLDK